MISNQEYKRRCKIHAKRRAKERYGINLSSKIRKTFLRMISENDYRINYLYRSGRSKVLSIHYKGKSYKVVYDPALDAIKTLLPNSQKLNQSEITKALKTHVFGE